ncbi:MAG TPA: hypothetical protein VG406_01745 [Isosphaeraceae bacterium]|jgi:hypothetical protein|nr:hypothetical protein [Isosphaeraceae bacterium]
MIRRLRVILPPDWAIVSFAIVIVLVSLPEIVAARNGLAPPPQVKAPRLLLLGAGLAALGAFRVVGFHPSYRQGYRRWLEMTPWRLGQPLPVGPIHLVWEDAVILSAMIGPSWYLGDAHPLGLLAIFLASYLFCLAGTFPTTGASAYSWAVLFGLGGVARLNPWPEYAAGAAIALYVVAWLGLRRSLGRFPWPPPAELPQGMPKLAASTDPEPSSNSRLLGWPSDRLSPKIDQGLRLGAVAAVLSSLLAGWWVYALSSLIPHPDARDHLVYMVYGYGLLSMIAARLAIYVTGYAPPISFWGRLARLRPIVPGYDRVLVAPLAALVLGVLGPIELYRMGVSSVVALSATLASALLVTLLSGPGLREWHLTGHHRIVPALNKNKKEFVQTS